MNELETSTMVRAKRERIRSAGLLLGWLVCGLAGAAERFEVAAWVDHFDFAGVKQSDGAYMYDTETAAGCRKVLQHVYEVGATTILWRNCGGATMRYQSNADGHHHAAVIDKRRIPDSRPIHGWVRYGDTEPDILRCVMEACKADGLRGGVHWPFEETHWAVWTIGRWNLEHPQFWGRSADGQPWWGRCSLAFEEVVEHKLALVDELVQRGIESLFIDTYRNGGWSPGYEYVDPVIARWRRAHGTDPPLDPKNAAWCRLVAGDVTRFLQRVRQRLDASGRKIDLMVGVANIAPISDAPLLGVGVDWREWIELGVIDTLVINWVRWDGKDAFGSTGRLCRQVMDMVGGRCRVLWPVRAYDYSGFGMPSYAKATGLTQAEIAARLMRMAWEEGADGISLECVDHNNYGPDTRKAMRALAEGACRWKRSE